MIIYIYNMIIYLLDKLHKSSCRVSQDCRMIANTICDRSNSTNKCICGPSFKNVNNWCQFC